MKKLVLILTWLAVTAINCLAQQGEIIYTNFEPDLSIEELSPYDSHDTLGVDLDQDGTIDFKMFIEAQYPTQVRYVYVTSSWDFRYCYNSIYSYGYMDENDTLIPYPTWAVANSIWELLWHPDQYMEFIMGFRKTVDGGSLYAWAKIYMYRNLNGNGYEPGAGEFDIVSTYCDDMAFCTVPDYPLRWGQTSLNDGLEDNSAKAFASLHPNPTSGSVTITGEKLKQAKVFNMLGQQVLSINGEGNELQIDMAALPAGVYFINVTDEEGRKCLRKVMKD